MYDNGFDVELNGYDGNGVDIYDPVSDEWYHVDGVDDNPFNGMLDEVNVIGYPPEPPKTPEEESRDDTNKEEPPCDDPCECRGDCYEPPTEKPQQNKDCAGVVDGDAYLDDCNKCVGGTTKKEPCDPCDNYVICKTCGGIIGEKGSALIKTVRTLSSTHGATCTKRNCSCDGYCKEKFGANAYRSKCGECVDGDSKFWNALSEKDNRLFESALSIMQQKCVERTLLNSISSNSGITVTLGDIDSKGKYDPCSNSITINGSTNLNEPVLREELFHAYQNQLNAQWYYEVLSNENNNNYKSGCNIEFEAKAMAMLADMVHGISPPDRNKSEYTALYTWLNNYCNNHRRDTNIGSLTSAELQGWFNAMEAFRSKYEGEEDLLYGKPIDYGKQPKALLNLLNEMLEDGNCNL